MSIGHSYWVRLRIRGPRETRGRCVQIFLLCSLQKHLPAFPGAYYQSPYPCPFSFLSENTVLWPCNLLLSVVLQVACAGLVSHILGLLIAEASHNDNTRPQFPYSHMFLLPLLHSLSHHSPYSLSLQVKARNHYSLSMWRCLACLSATCHPFPKHPLHLVYPCPLFFPCYLMVFLPSGSGESTFFSDSGTTGRRRKYGWLGIRLSFQWQWGWCGVPLEDVQELEETFSPRQREVCADLSLPLWGWYWIFCRSYWSVQTDEF